MYNNRRPILGNRRMLRSVKVGDYMCLALLITAVPSTFLFVFMEVLPSFHNVDSLYFVFACLVGAFILFNIEGNLFATIYVDTTIDSSFTACELKPPTNYIKLRKWHYCEDCEVMVPPRTSHCDTCSICILTRTHHCLFTGNCVGRKNRRYFMMMLVYLAVGSTASTIYMSMYLWVLKKDIFFNSTTLLKVICPMLMIITESTWQHFYIMVYDLNLIAALISMVLLVFHFKLILRGILAYECSKSRRVNLSAYEYKRNLEEVFGERMHLVWLSPLIESDLPLQEYGSNWGVRTRRM